MRVEGKSGEGGEGSVGSNEFDVLGFNPDRIHARLLAQNLADLQFQQVSLKSNDWKNSTNAQFKE
jgi:hypothetical protein